MSKAASSTTDETDVVASFRHMVNMTATELTRWLETEESRQVGQKRGSESIGHRSGRRIVELLGKKTGELNDSDRDHMRKVVGYIKRHMAQRPEQSLADIRQSAWRFSLMNWGHDPLKHH